jgi:hypothetical protein
MSVKMHVMLFVCLGVDTEVLLPPWLREGSGLRGVGLMEPNNDGGGSPTLLCCQLGTELCAGAMMWDGNLLLCVVLAALVGGVAVGVTGGVVVGLMGSVAVSLMGGAMVGLMGGVAVGLMIEVVVGLTGGVVVG